jgi:hypothetical protein
MEIWLQADGEGRLGLEHVQRRSSSILTAGRTVEAVQAAFRCAWPGFATEFTQAFAFALDSKVRAGNLTESVVRNFINDGNKLISLSTLQLFKKNPFSTMYLARSLFFPRIREIRAVSVPRGFNRFFEMIQIFLYIFIEKTYLITITKSKIKN